MRKIVLEIEDIDEELTDEDVELALSLLREEFSGVSAFVEFPAK